LAELVALTEALRLSKEQRVNIYTDSKYVFLILHAHASIWKKREMLTTIGAASLLNYLRLL
jgi:ribonuclease HI